MKNTCNVILVGPMGAGKTRVGQILARRLCLPFYDTDQSIEERTGVDIPFIFDKEGEWGFRKREKEIVEELTQKKGIVLSTGGGTVLTISGQNFLTDPAKLVVTIAGSQCSVSSVATTQITCATNFYMYSSITAPIEVFILDNGFALNVSSYLCECKFLFNS